MRPTMLHGSLKRFELSSLLSNRHSIRLVFQHHYDGATAHHGGIGIRRSASISASMPFTCASTTIRPFSRVASVASPNVPLRDQVLFSRTAAAESRVSLPAPG